MMDAITGDVTADHAANAKTAHPMKINNNGRMRFRFFFRPWAVLRFPGLFPPEGVGAREIAGWLYMSHLMWSTNNGSSGLSGVETRFTTERTESAEILKGFSL
jgi:hypothetical protein